MSLISISHLTFAYDGCFDNVFEDVSLRLDTDWKLGLTGRNGRGKTTLLKLLLGRYEYTGTISASVEFEYFPYDVLDKNRRTSEVFSELCPGVPLWRVEKELRALALSTELMSRPFLTLSNGEQTKLLLAALFLRENRFLLIDEPTNHLDMEGRELVSRYLDSKKGFILVSHDRVFLDGCVDHILSINRGGVELQSGNFSSWLANRERQDRFETEQNLKLKKEIDRLTSAARQSRAWADHAERAKIGPSAQKELHPEKNRRSFVAAQSSRMQQRRKNLERRQQAAIEEKAALLKDIESAEALKLCGLNYRGGRLIALRDVGVAYGKTPICTGVTFTIEPGDRVALCGKNGSGKSSVLRLICGEAVPHTGTVETGSRLKLSCVPQDASALCGDLREYARQAGIDESLFKTILRKLDFSRVQFEKDMADFSAGQRKKVLLARSLCEQAHLYVWDEPMNYIDVISRIQIETLLLDFRPTILFVEHDRAFCEKIATKTVRL